ncbi:MAG: hypothetical protein GY832_37895 [Chloroflexi bacterium]|nr:hypothetical protein [Chloroflexota bacterium]
MSSTETRNFFVVHLRACHRDVAPVPISDSLRDAIPHHRVVCHLIGRLLAAFPDPVERFVHDLIQEAARESVRLSEEEPHLPHKRVYGRLQYHLEAWVNRNRALVCAPLRTQWRRLKAGDEPVYHDGVRIGSIRTDGVLPNGIRGVIPEEREPTVYDFDLGVVDVLETLRRTADPIERAILAPVPADPASLILGSQAPKDKRITMAWTGFRATVEYTRTRKPGIAAIHRYCPSLPSAQEFLDRFPPDLEGNVPILQYRSTAELAEMLRVSESTTCRHRRHLWKRYREIAEIPQKECQQNEVWPTN